MKIKSKSKCDLLTEEIIGQIVQGVYRPGDKLPPENELIAAYQVSRVTVRESLKKLSAMGIVSICQGDGTFINHFNLRS